MRLELSVSPSLDLSRRHIDSEVDVRCPTTPRSSREPMGSRRVACGGVPSHWDDVAGDRAGSPSEAFATLTWARAGKPRQGSPHLGYSGLIGSSEGSPRWGLPALAQIKVG
ncbi:hypothetical protein NL676_007782 [Syzygium grande]|nr:hypothetical protein NL676_007782 [Syzygium grande]